MAQTAKQLRSDVLALPEDERLDLACDIIASIDGPAEQAPDWDAAWLAELDRRRAAAEVRGDAGSDWREARARILARLTAK
jgi:putative addiction module component (TIGR02574 family)